MHVLVVEDSPTQAAALRALLEGAGYEVGVAATGEDGLGQIEARRFDVIISDVVMPGPMDGYALCRHIKAGPHRDTPVVLLTSLSDPLDIIHGLECGADNFLTKPYEPAHLLERLTTLLGTRATRGRAKVRVGVDIFFMGREFTITSEREQILDLLISTFEDAVRHNVELRQREAELETARHELARHAGSLQARLQQVLASTPAVIYTITIRGSSLIPNWVSENVTAATGFSEEEALHPTWWSDQLHPEDRPRVMGELRTLFTKGSLVTEYRFRRRDGSYRWFRDAARLVRDVAGDPSQIVGAWVDVTDERRLQEQVRLAQKMDAVGTLAGGVAHDLNNILGVIRATAELVLLDLEPASALREDFEAITGAVDRAGALTQQLLAFGRKQVLEPRPVDFNDLLSGTVKMIERIIGDDIRLVRRLTSDPLVVQADPGQLEQVLMNLCVNARDAMPEGGEVAVLTERVSIDEEFCVTHPWARPGEYARLTVSDTGTGMDFATQARIFEPFFTTKELGRGTGLGLAVVYGIVKQHGGLIHVYSEPGKGTAFRVYFPLHDLAPEPITAANAPEVKGGTETILLAEDDGVLRVTVKKLLERLGYQVIAVANGEEAVEALAERGDAIRLAVVDVVMPKLGGLQVFEQVHARYPGLSFIFATGYSPGTSHTEPIQTLPAEVLPKPYSLQDLARVVRRALEAGPREG